MAEYAKARGIDTEPAFRWRVPYTLRKSEAIISSVRARVRKTTHKYGSEVPRDLEHAHNLDLNNGNDHWAKSMKKKMRNLGIAFKILD